MAGGYDSMIVRIGSQAGLQDISPYVLGIGNKEHDALGGRGICNSRRIYSVVAWMATLTCSRDDDDDVAYNLAGMNADRIFVIDEVRTMNVSVE